MPDTRGRPLPSEVLSALKDASITNWLKSFVIQQSSSMSIGRYPGNGSAQDDQYVYPDDADATHPYNFDYVIPSNFQRLVSAKLSFKIRPYRTYSTFTPGSNTGAGTSHNHAQGTSAAGSAHRHAFNPEANTTGASNITWDSAGSRVASSEAAPSDATSVQTEAAHTHALGNGGTENAHTHPMSGSSVLGISEDVTPNNPGITVAVDGADVTAKLGGPFNVDMVEVDVTQVLKTGVKLWHTLSLQPNQRVRITGILRISYYNDSRLAQ